MQNQVEMMREAVNVDQGESVVELENYINDCSS